MTVQETAGTGTTLIRGGLVVDVDRARAFRGDVLVEGTRIADVRPGTIEVGPDVRVVDASDRLVMPGLVNAHTHGHGSLGKGAGDLWSLELLLNASPWASGGMTDEDRRLAATLNAAEMVKKGCTAGYDLFAQIPQVSAASMAAAAAGYRDAGVRAVLAPMIADRSFYEAVPGLLDALPADARRALGGRTDDGAAAMRAELASWLQGWDLPEDEVRPALAPTIPTHCSQGFLEACRDLAGVHGVPLHMHLAESKPQAVAGIEVYGKSLTAYLADIGLLGPRFTAAHGIWLDGADIRRLADAGARVAHNPGSNLRLGSGIAPVREMIDAGLTVGVGSDGSVSSDHQNMFESTRLASFVSRVRSPDPDRWVTAGEALFMATAGGSAVLGFDGKIGRVAPGYYADLVLLDLASPSFVPLNDAVRQIVHCEDSGAVDTVMIGGRTVLSGGRFTELDYADLRRRANAAVERLRVETAEARRLADRLAATVQRHCVGLAARPYPVERLRGCPGAADK